MLTTLALKGCSTAISINFLYSLIIPNTIIFNYQSDEGEVKRMHKGKAIRIASRGVFVVAALLIMLSSQPVAAHTPTSMTLEYNWDTQVLSVTISHSVPNPNDHFIENITVYKNDVKVDSEAYTSQGSASTASDAFNIAAVDGDVLRVWANCSISGFIEDTITVTEPDTSTTTTTDGTTTPPPAWDSTMIILAAVVALGLIFLVVAMIRRR
jgi:desulfoferrodoxin (superoxide reductase-like protein)